VLPSRDASLRASGCSAPAAVLASRGGRRSHILKNVRTSRAPLPRRIAPRLWSPRVGRGPPSGGVRHSHILKNVRMFRSLVSTRRGEGGFARAIRPNGGDSPSRPLAATKLQIPYPNPQTNPNAVIRESLTTCRREQPRIFPKNKNSDRCSTVRGFSGRTGACPYCCAVVQE
jgi:hypothetical protein